MFKVEGTGDMQPAIYGELHVAGNGSYDDSKPPEFAFDYSLQAFTFTRLDTGADLPVSEWVGNTVMNLHEAHETVMAHLRKIFGLEPLNAASDEMVIRAIYRDKTEDIINVEYQLPGCSPRAIEISIASFQNWLKGTGCAISFQAYWAAAALDVKCRDIANYLTQTPGWYAANGMPFPEVVPMPYAS